MYYAFCKYATISNNRKNTFVCSFIVTLNSIWSPLGGCHSCHVRFWFNPLSLFLDSQPACTHLLFHQTHCHHFTSQPYIIICILDHVPVCERVDSLGTVPERRPLVCVLRLCFFSMAAYLFIFIADARDLFWCKIDAWWTFCEAHPLFVDCITTCGLIA